MRNPLFLFRFVVLAALCAVLLFVFSLPLVQAQDGAIDEQFVPPLRVLPSSSPQSEIVPGSVIVQFAPGTETMQAARLRSHMVATPLEVTANQPDIYRLAVNAGSEAEVVAQLQADPQVLFAEPEYLYHKTATPNDVLYSAYQWNLRHIRADAGWDRTAGSGDVIIAVVDTGVDLTHPDLVGKLVPGYDTYNNDSDPSDDDGHGTHVASIAAASSNNAEGIAGVSWGARIMPIKVLNANGSGSSTHVAQGITWAVDNGADVINLSLGGSNYSVLIANAVAYAHSRGVLVVAASGNHYKDGNPTTYPAAYNHVLAVAAINDADGHASYSSSGAYVDVAAPGGDPSSSADSNSRHWIPGAYWRGAGVAYAWLSGTSQAAPHVAGLAALLLSVNPNLMPDQLQSAITGTAVDVQAPGWDEFSGHGRIDVVAALAAVGAAAPASTATPTATPTATATHTQGPTATPTATATPLLTPTPTLPPRSRDDNRINSTTAHHQADAALGVDGAGNLTAVWRDGRNGVDALYAADMAANASYWGPNIAIASSQQRTTGSVIGAPALAVGTGTVYAVWQDNNEGGEPDIYLSQRTGSNPWTTPIQINDDIATPVPQRNPQIVAAGDGTLVALWEDGRSNPLDSTETGIYWSERKAGSNRWAASLPVYVVPATGQSEPTLAVMGTTVYAAWVQQGLTGTTLMVAQKALSAAMWSVPTPVATLNASDGGFSPSLAIAPDGTVLLAWADQNGAMGCDIFTAQQQAGGTVWSQPVRVNKDTGSADQGRPHLVAGPNGFVVVWEDERNGNADIFVAWKTSADVTWAGHRQVNQDGTTLPQLAPAVAMDRYGNTTVAWSDYRNDPAVADVYARFIGAAERFANYLPQVKR